MQNKSSYIIGGDRQKAETLWWQLWDYNTAMLRASLMLKQVEQKSYEQISFNKSVKYMKPNI